MTIIRDPSTGDGMTVSKDFRAAVDAIVITVANSVSFNDQEAYVLQGSTSWAAASGEQTMVFLENTSSSQLLVITKLIGNIITDLTLPNTGSFFAVNSSSDYSSGGVLAVPQNEHIGSPKSADIIAYVDDPVLTGTAVVHASIPAQGNGVPVPSSSGTTLIIEPTQSIHVSFTPAASHTGTAYAYVGFYMLEP